MAIPFLDLERLHESIRPELDAAFDRVVRASSFTGGGVVGDFEDAFAVAHGRGGAAGCGSGTDALVLALRALGVGRGDEVIVPAMTFFATAEAVLLVGAEPVLADVDPRSLLLTATAVEEVRTPRTRAVIPVHLYGHIVAFDLIEAWKDSGLLVIEDAAQAHLGHWRGRPIGQASHATCFSFYPGKNLGALGDGGAVASDDHALLDEVRRLRDHGARTKHRHEVVGYCSRLDGLQASMLLAKLPYLAGWTSRRVERAEQYREQLGSPPLVPWEHGAVHHLLVTRVEASARPAIVRHLAALGIETGLHYPVALSEQPALAGFRRPCPAAEAAAASVLSLPLDPLMVASDVDRVCATLLG